MPPQPPDWKQVIDVGSQFTEVRRAQARRIAKDLVSQGELARDQVATAVDEIVEASRRRSEALRDVVRHEVQRQLGALGIATKDDLARLERRLAGGAAKAKAPAAKKAPASKATAKKAGPTKAGTTKSAAKQAPAKKAPAKKTAKQAT